MQTIGVSPKKFLGQNFLINPLVIQKMITAIKNLSPSLIVEVGPGLGALTEELILLKKPFYAVEIDPLLCQYWKERKVSIIEGNVLKTPWPDVLLPGSILTGNLPYSFASRLLIKCCPGPDKLKAMALMFQKEVSQRIITPPGSKNYGLLSVLSQSFWNIKRLLIASPQSFYPRPKVSGEILIFKRKKHFISDPLQFLSFVKFCFAQRRKILLSRLKKKNPHAENCFKKMDIPLSARAEELSCKQFADLFNYFFKNPS